MIFDIENSLLKNWVSEGVPFDVNDFFTLVSYECFIDVKTQVYWNKNALLEKLLTYCEYNYHYAIES